MVAGADRAALKLWVPAFGTFLLGAGAGAELGGALLAGVVAGFGLFHVVWLAWPLSSVWAWLPWVLLATDHVVRGPRAEPSPALALVVALQYFGGHPETSFHVLAVAFLFALLRVTAEPDRRWCLGGGPLAGTALAAVVLIPFLELLAHSSDLANRSGRDPAQHAAALRLALALPDYWGRPTQVVLEPFIVSRAFYAGALPLMLAVVALLRPDARAGGDRRDGRGRAGDRPRRAAVLLRRQPRAGFQPGPQHAAGDRDTAVHRAARRLGAGRGPALAAR